MVYIIMYYMIVLAVEQINDMAKYYKVLVNYIFYQKIYNIFELMEAFYAIKKKRNFEIISVGKNIIKKLAIKDWNNIGIILMMQLVYYRYVIHKWLDS